MPDNPNDWDNLLFTNSAGAVDRIKRETLAEARAQSHRDYAAVTNRKDWERMFYSTYPHLGNL